MIKPSDIIQDGHETLAKVAQKISLPISKEDRELVLNLLQYVISSQNDEVAKKFGLRPAVGIAAPQINVSKAAFAMVCEGKNKLHCYGIVNPKIINKSSDLTFLETGEGCLSVDDDYTGFVDRHTWVEFEAYILNLETMKLEKTKKKLEGFPAIVFQHEYDHLQGVMFTNIEVEKEDLKGQPFEF